MIPEGAWRALRKDPPAATALVVVSVLVAGAVLVPVVSGTDLAATAITERLQAPSWAGGDGGWLGTDQLGRDLALLISHGLRTSFLVGALAVALGAGIGTLFGMLAGYVGGWVDALIMRLTEVQMSFPSLLLVMTLVTVYGRGTLLIIVFLGLNSWMLYARVARVMVLSLRRSELVMSVESIGASTSRILVRHVLPNSLVGLLAVAAVEFARAMLAEASLSFLGFGVEPPQVSLGLILAGGRDHLEGAWWIATFAGLFLAISVLSTNLMAAWLQRITDPIGRLGGR